MEKEKNTRVFNSYEKHGKSYDYKPPKTMIDSGKSMIKHLSGIAANARARIIHAKKKYLDRPRAGKALHAEFERNFRKDTDRANSMIATIMEKEGTLLDNKGFERAEKLRDLMDLRGGLIAEYEAQIEKMQAFILLNKAELNMETKKRLGMEIIQLLDKIDDCHKKIKGLQRWKASTVAVYN